MSEINAADNFTLFVKVLQRHFHAPVLQHPAMNGDALPAREVPRGADRRWRRAQVALDAVLQARAFTRQEDAKLGMLEAVVGNVVAAQRGRGKIVAPALP